MRNYWEPNKEFFEMSIEELIEYVKYCSSQDRLHKIKVKKKKRKTRKYLREKRRLTLKKF
jgi:hypothetical protein